MNVVRLETRTGAPTADAASGRDRKETGPVAGGQPKGQATKFPDDKRRAFEWLSPAAIALVATDHALSVSHWDHTGIVRRIGHNRAVWPAKVAKTAIWRDTVTTAYDKGPFFELGTQFRVWCLPVDGRDAAADRDRLAASVIDLIDDRAARDGGVDELLHGFKDLGPDLDLSLFEVEIHDIAARLGIPTADDDGLSDWLDRVLARAHEMKRQGRVRDRDEELLERAASAGCLVGT